MYDRFTTNTVGTGLLALVGLTLGCGQRAPSAPTQVPPTTPLSVAAIAPSTGSSASPVFVTIRGTGFLAGAAVTLGAAATGVNVIDGTTITAMAPVHEAGIVDVVVTNPAGPSARLAAAFTYVDQLYAITSSTSTVAAGGQLSVSWTAPRGGASDWIGFFKVTDSSYDYEFRWWQYTGGGSSGTLTLDAPTTPGQYEFRYLLDDGYVDAARSTPVTVTAG